MQNGGWDNWDMIEIAKYNCKDSTEARIREQEHYKLLNSTLNSCPPYVDKSNYYCKYCNKQYNTPKEFQTHINTKIHNLIKETIIKNYNIDKELFKNVSEKNYICVSSDNNSPKTQNNSDYKYICKKCNYYTNKLNDFNKHKTTSKHIKLSVSEEFTDKLSYLSHQEYKCNCGKNINIDKVYSIIKKNVKIQKKNKKLILILRKLKTLLLL